MEKQIMDNILDSWIVQSLIAGIVTLLGWVGIYHSKRITKTEQGIEKCMKTHVHVETYKIQNDHTNDLLAKIEKGVEKIDDKLDRHISQGK